ncbi:hypothetical protein [Nonomuraea soli]|uniref:Integral membrane protein n=1 Tax=Nonomuraea soli TaxID=1032476 RepID=A0A7W0HQM7_9ACTN|nr:hypothetical protein [Nonomuraea soli]MBA2892030.1 hypothetical protein [Nonomuraea soli]
MSENPEHDELIRLRAEVERLQSERRSGWWRGLTSVVLITLGCILMPVSAVAVWTANEISSTDRFVENVAPLASDPAVQNAVVNRTTNAIMAKVPVEQLVDEALGALSLPPKLAGRLEALAGPLTSGVTTFVHNAVQKVVQSDAFPEIWASVTKVAHNQLVGVLSGEGTQSVKVSGDTISLDLGPLIGRVEQALVANGVGFASMIPDDLHPTITLFEAQDLQRYQNWYTLLTTLKWALPLLALVLIALGVYVARSRRRALIGAGVGLVASMLVLLAGLTIGQKQFLNMVTGAGLDRAAADAIFEIVTRFLITGLRTVLVVGLVLALAAFFTGPSPKAVATRSGVRKGLTRLRGDLDLGRTGSWVWRYRRGLQLAACVVAGAVFVWWEHPSGLVVIGITACLLLALLVIEFLGLPPRTT